MRLHVTLLSNLYVHDGICLFVCVLLCAVRLAGP